MAITNVQLGTGETTILSAAAETAVLSIIFCNTTSSNKTITVYAYASGGSASDTTTIVKNYVIPAYDSFIWSANEKFILDTSGKISGLCDSATSVSATINYKAI